MNELVLKFGGSSLSNARNISNVADIIIEHYLTSTSIELDVVASAIGAVPQGKKEDKVTERLLSAANYVLSNDREERKLALSEIKWVRGIHDGIVADLWLDKSSIRGTLDSLEKTVKDSLADLDSGKELKKEKLEDSFAGFGELLSTPILAAVVQKKLEKRFKDLDERLHQSGLNEREQKIYEHLKSCNGQYTVVLDPRERGFLTDSNFGNATLLVKSLDTEIAKHHQSARAKNRSRILFYAGYVARDEYGNQTTLGRDGSNVTAIALAAAIKARQVIIYSDTDGVLIANPSVIGESQTARYLSYKEESILAEWGGMKALQANSLQILNRRNVKIPIVVKSSFNSSDPGTLLTHESIESRYNIKGIGVISNISYREFPLDNREQFEKIIDILREYDGISLLWSSLEEDKNGKLKGRFLLAKDQKKEERVGKDYFGRRLHYEIKQRVYGGKLHGSSFDFHDLSLVTVCGEGLGKSYAELSKIERILAGTKTAGILADNAYRLPLVRTRDTIHVVVRKEEADKVIRAIYNQLKRINIVLYGLGSVGLEFLRRVKERYDELGLTVVGVADTSGSYAKPGGFSAEELSSIIEMKKKGVKARDMDKVKDAVNITERKGSLQRIYEMSKGDSVLVDATDDTFMLTTLLRALQLDYRVISINKLPYAIQSKIHEGKTLEGIADEKVRKLFKAMLKRQVYNRGTVGADLGVPGTLLRILAQNPNYVTVMGCMSGTLGSTCTVLDKGKSLSEAISGAVHRKIAEPNPFVDYSGLDVLNKLTILWRTIATKYGISFFDCDINYESFINPAIRRYGQKTGKKFETSDLHKLDGSEFIERMKLLDESFAELRAELDANHVFRYVGEINYNSQTGRYSLNVRLKPVHKESSLGSLEGTENMVLFGVDEPPKRAYGIDIGPGAGISQTADAIIHDLEQINAIVRGEAMAKEIPYRKYKPQKPVGKPWNPFSQRARILHSARIARYIT